jgi:hypothetical protein
MMCAFVPSYAGDIGGSKSRSVLGEMQDITLKKKKPKAKRAGGVALLAENPPTKCRAQSSNSRMTIYINYVRVLPSCHHCGPP